MVKILIWLCNMNLCKHRRRGHGALSSAVHVVPPLCLHCSNYLTRHGTLTVCLCQCDTWCGLWYLQEFPETSCPDSLLAGFSQVSVEAHWQGDAGVGLPSRKWRFVHDCSPGLPGPWHIPFPLWEVFHLLGV